MEKRLETLGDTRNYAQEVLETLIQKKCNLVGLYGELGAGKTAFAKEMASILGVTETVTSPTFTIMKSYETKNSVFKKMVHIDAYRFEEAQEAHILDLQNLITDPNTLVLIEWPEKAGEYMPLHTKIHITLCDDESRIITTLYEKN